MCYVSQKITCNRRVLHVYKVVSRNGASLFSPSSRGESGGWPTRGQVLRYTPGTVVASPSGPGIMAFLSLRCAQIEAHNHRRIVVLSIPRGAFVRAGNWRLRKIICASKVRVLKRRVK